MFDPEIKGMQALQSKKNQMIRDLSGGGELLTAFRNATMIILRDVKEGAPVDTGRGRASITPEVTTEGTSIYGVVGTNVDYMAAHETGTGRTVGRPIHWPPGGALQRWAERHGFQSGYQVARIIGLRGGLKALNYFQKAFDKNEPQVRSMISEAIVRIVDK